MPNGWNHGEFPWPQERFQQFVIDHLEHDKAWKESLAIDCAQRLEAATKREERIRIIETHIDRQNVIIKTLAVVWTGIQVVIGWIWFKS